MAEVREPGGAGYKVITVLGVLFFLVVVAVLIRSYDDGEEVVATAPVVTAPASAQAETQTPVGAVATGGGGMAGAGTSNALPVVLGIVVVTFVAAAAGGMTLRRRGGLTPV